MTIFMKNHQVYLTPISPIHIGCGEDFEPTNYTIDNNVLYHFDPSNLYLSIEQKKELLNKVLTLELLEIQRFFLKHKKESMSFSHYFSSVPKNIATKWEEKIGKVAKKDKKDSKVINQLVIERTAYLPYHHHAYIPGSSFKGALATAFLDNEHKKCRKGITPSKISNKYLLKEYIGEFDKSKFRTVKFSDFTPLHNIYTQVYYALNYKKVPKKDHKKSKGIHLCRECILAGQYRVFQSELSLWKNSNNSLTIKDYFDILNQYHQPIFIKECESLIANNFVSLEWVKQIKALLTNKNIALVRLGKNGADSKVYQDESITKIKINKEDSKFEYKNASTTLWLAAESDTQTSNLLPFGWAIIEVDPQEDNMALKQWCEQQPKSGFDRDAILQKRKALEAEKQRQIAEQKAKRDAERQAEIAKKAFFDTLNDHQKCVMNFVNQVNATREIQSDTTGSVLLKSLIQLVESAVISWDESEKDFLHKHITPELIKTKVKFNKKDGEKNLKKLLNKLTVN